MRPLSAFTVVAVLVIGAAACTGTHGVATTRIRRDPRLITHEDILRSGAVDAFDAVRRAHTNLAISEARGQYALNHEVQVTSRGRSSLTLSPQILLVVDNVMRLDVTSLHDIPADNIEWIHILTAMEATPFYGSDGGNGAIIVQTRIPRADSN